MAAGESSRFNGDCKQLLPIPPTGEPIILRTIRYVSEIDPKAGIAVYTCKKDLADAIKGIATVRWLNGPTNSIITTLLKSSRDWRERNIILLGDVAYTRAGLEKIFSSEISSGMVANPRVKPHERYAILFDREKEVEIKNACVRALALGPLSGNSDIKLVNICASQIRNRMVRYLVTCPRPRILRPFIDYWMYHIQPRFSYPWYYLQPEQMVFLNDETQDIDCPEEYEEYCLKYR